MSRREKHPGYPNGNGWPGYCPPELRADVRLSWASENYAVSPRGQRLKLDRMFRVEVVFPVESGDGLYCQEEKHFLVPADVLLNFQRLQRLVLRHTGRLMLHEAEVGGRMGRGLWKKAVRRALQRGLKRYPAYIRAVNRPVPGRDSDWNPAADF